MTSTSTLFASQGELAFLAELASAAYRPRTDLNLVDAVNTTEVVANDTNNATTDTQAANFAIVAASLTLLGAADMPSLAPVASGDPWFPSVGLEGGIYTHSNAGALVGRTDDALFISFRGTNDFSSLFDLFTTPDSEQWTTAGKAAHYDLFAGLRTAIDTYLASHAEITKIYVTGHSLGGAMVDAFMQEHAGDARFEAVTFGSLGYGLGPDLADMRITNLLNYDDIAQYYDDRTDGDHNSIVDNIGWPLESHSMDLYVAETQFLKANGIDLAAMHANPDYDTYLFNVTSTATGYDIGLANDELAGTAGADAMLGGAGDDRMFGNGGHDWLIGGIGNDTLVGNADIFAQDSDILDGGAGNDAFYAEFTDTIIGGAGTDILYVVNSYDFTIDLGATSIEWILADFGNDVISAATQSVGVTIYASGGNDSITGSELADTIWAGVGNDTVSANGGDDVIIGDLGIDSLSAGDGNDRVYADTSDSFLDGGAGFDALYITATTTYSIDMAATHFEWISDFGAASDIIDGSGLSVRLEAYAGNGNDTITGGSAGDFLWGEAGNDAINGGAGDDTLVGGSGADVLNGGAGIDTIFANSGGGGDGAIDVVVFDAAGWGTDFVYDFEHGRDKLDLHGSGAAPGTVSITNVGGHAELHFGSDVIVVVGAGATLLAGDILF